MSLDSHELRRAFGTFMTGVTVVTTHNPQTLLPEGFTANSFTSVSLDPPLVSVCINATVRLHPVFEGAESFAVNILAADQRDISNRFASSVEDRFADISWQRSLLGNPLLEGVTAWLDCRIESRVPAGDHLMLVGEVRDFHYTDQPGLGYVRGNYFTAVLEQDALGVVSEGRRICTAALIKADRKILLMEENGQRRLPRSEPRNRAADSLNDLRKRLRDLGVQGEIGEIYALEHEADPTVSTVYFQVSARTLAGLQAGATLTPFDALPLADMDPFEARILSRFVAESQLGPYR